MKNLEIRYINASDDRMKISKIYEESWKYAYKDIIPKDYLDSIESEKLVSVLDLPGSNTIVCVENDKFIGTCSFSKSRFKEYSSYGEII